MISTINQGIIMIIIIDGYNLLKTLQGPQATTQQRSELLSFLGEYRKRQGHDIIVVFDGGPSIRPIIERESGLTVILSGSRFSADYCIIEYVQARPEQDMMVVTADREVLRAIAVHTVPGLDPYTFYHRVHKRLSQIEKSEFIDILSSNVIKYGDEDLPEDELMYQAASMIAGVKKEEDGRVVLNKRNKISKKNRVLNAIKNKL